MPDMNMSSVTSHADFFVKYILSNWSLDLPVSIPFIFIPLFLYVRGLRKAEAKRYNGEGVIPGSENQNVIVFGIGMTLLTLSILSPIMYWAMVYLWMHILFHIFVMVAAPPLIAFSKPWKVMEAGIPEKFLPKLYSLVQAAKGRGLFGKFIRFATNPAVDLAYFNLIMLLWFLPQMMTWAVDNKYAMILMHYTFITAGMLLFTQLIDSFPYRSRVPDPVRRLGMLLVCAVTSWIIAMFIGFSPHPLYSVYSDIAGKAISPMADQQIAASLLWVLCMEPFIYTAYYNIKLWITMSEENLLPEFRKPWVRNN